VNRDELRKHAEELVPSKTMWLTILAGSVSGVAGSVAFGYLFFELPAILILGTILQRWSPRPGRWFMWLGAFFLTVDVGVFFSPVILHPPNSLDFGIVVFLLFMASLVLVCWCDVALIMDAFRSKNSPAFTGQEFPTIADWIIGIIAACLTAWEVWSILARFYAGRPTGNWLLLVALAVCVAAFDIAFVVHTVRTFRR
jgi:hypothetical protein